MGYGGEQPGRNTSIAISIVMGLAEAFCRYPNVLLTNIKFVYHVRPNDIIDHCIFARLTPRGTVWEHWAPTYQTGDMADGHYRLVIALLAKSPLPRIQSMREGTLELRPCNMETRYIIAPPHPPRTPPGSPPTNPKYEDEDYIGEEFVEPLRDAQSTDSCDGPPKFLPLKAVHIESRTRSSTSLSLQDCDQNEVSLG